MIRSSFGDIEFTVIRESVTYNHAANMHRTLQVQDCDVRRLLARSKRRVVGELVIGNFHLGQYVLEHVTATRNQATLEFREPTEPDKRRVRLWRWIKRVIS